MQGVGAPERESGLQGIVQAMSSEESEIVFV